MAIEERRWPDGPSPTWDSSDKWAITVVSEIELAVFEEEEHASIGDRRTYGEILNFMVPVDLTRLAATVYGVA